MCFDGESIIVSLDEADLAAGEVDVAALGDEGMLPPFTNGVGACADARYDEPTTPEYPGGCTPTEGAIRSRWAALTGDGARPLPPRRPDSDSPLLVSSRGWGPNNGGADLRFRGMPASSLFGGEEMPPPAPELAVAAGAGGEEITSAAAGVGPWHAGTLGLAVQPDTRVVARGALGDAYSTSRLLCSRRGVVTGAKPKLLTGRADGWLLRQYAYMATGLAAEG